MSDTCFTATFTLLMQGTPENTGHAHAILGKAAPSRLDIYAGATQADAPRHAAAV